MKLNLRVLVLFRRSFGFGAKHFEVAIEEVHASLVVTDEVELVEDGACQGFFFNLLANVPLHKIVGGVVFFAQAHVGTKPMNGSRSRDDLRLMPMMCTK